MIAPAAFAIILALFVIEATILWIDQLHRHRREAAHWTRFQTELYDWEREGWA